MQKSLLFASALCDIKMYTKCTKNGWIPRRKSEIVNLHVGKERAKMQISRRRQMLSGNKKLPLDENDACMIK